MSKVAEGLRQYRNIPWERYDASAKGALNDDRPETLDLFDGLAA